MQQHRRQRLVLRRLRLTTHHHHRHHYAYHLISKKMVGTQYTYFTATPITFITIQQFPVITFIKSSGIPKPARMNSSQPFCDTSGADILSIWPPTIPSKLATHLHSKRTMGGPDCAWNPIQRTGQDWRTEDGVMSSARSWAQDECNKSNSDFQIKKHPRGGLSGRPSITKSQRKMQMKLGRGIQSHCPRFWNDSGHPLLWTTFH